MIYLSPDYECGDESIDATWDEMARHQNAALQYPYQIGRGDICLVDAMLGMEYVPEKVGGGLVVAAVLHGFHTKRRETGKDIWNVQIHRTNGCCIVADEVATASAKEAAEILRMFEEQRAAGEEISEKAVVVVEDWQKYLNALTARAEREAGQ